MHKFNCWAYSDAALLEHTTWAHVYKAVQHAEKLLDEPLVTADEEEEYGYDVWVDYIDFSWTDRTGRLFDRIWWMGEYTDEFKGYQGRILRLFSSLDDSLYVKTQGVLRGGDAYCIGGVMCEHYRGETGLGKWVPVFGPTGDFGFISPDGTRNHTHMPEVVQDYYGLSGKAVNTLMRMNDDTNFRFEAMGLEMLRLTGLEHLADHLELSN